MQSLPSLPAAYTSNHHLPSLAPAVQARCKAPLQQGNESAVNTSPNALQTRFRNVRARGGPSRKEQPGAVAERGA